MVTVAFRQRARLPVAELFPFTNYPPPRRPPTGRQTTPAITKDPRLCSREGPLPGGRPADVQPRSLRLPTGGEMYPAVRGLQSQLQGAR